MRWSEVDFDRGLIALPPERTKSHREHEIMLSAPATAILRARPRLTYPDGTPCGLIFGRGQRGFSDWVGSKFDLDKRMERKLPGWTLHDFRRLTFAHGQQGDGVLRAAGAMTRVLNARADQLKIGGEVHDDLGFQV